MRESILAYHYAGRLKTVFLLTSGLLEGYERSDRREEIIYSLFDALEGEVNTAEAVLGKTSTERQRRLEEARHSLHQALQHFNTGEMGKSREQIAKAISSVATVAEEAMRELGL